MASQGEAAPFSKTLGEADSKLFRSLLGGHYPSFANAVMANPNIREAVLTSFLNLINAECNTLCKKLADPPSRFRKIDLGELSDFSWKPLIIELQDNAPVLFKILTSIVSHSDSRNNFKVGSAHFSGICTAVSVVLKERNREMCGIQSLVSLLMYSSCCEKQVHVIYTCIHLVVTKLLTFTIQVYSWLNHLNLCVSYPATLRLIDNLSKTNTVPLQKWLDSGVVFR